MKIRKLNAAVLTLALVIITGGVSAAETPGIDHVPGELIVKFEKGVIDLKSFDETPMAKVPVSLPQLTPLLQKYNVRSVEHVFKGVFAREPFKLVTKRGEEVQFKDLSQVYLLRMDSKLDMKQVALKMQNLPGVIYAEPNYVAQLYESKPDDPDFDDQWGLDNQPDDETGIKWDVNAIRAWKIETGDPDVLLAILDTGLEDEHNDENGDEFRNPIPRVEGCWWVEPYSSSYDDKYGHGTHVTGIAAASTYNEDPEVTNKGTAGVAGGWENERGTSLLVANCFWREDNEGRPQLANIVAAIEWATEQGADVLNGSFGAPIGLEVQREAIENAFAADMTLFFATGNDDGEIGFPARWAYSDICCAVGAMNSSGQRVSYSNYGPEISFVAPGSGIYSTDIARSYYGNKSGTSMASPHAAGVAALLYSADLDCNAVYLSDVDCKRIMEKSARDIYEPPYSPGWDTLTGYGCVDAWEALRHMHWPYQMDRGTISNSNLQVEDLGIHTIVFTGPTPHGTYPCRVYRLSATVQFSPSFVETPWVWGRLMDSNTGFSGANPNDCAFHVNVTNVTSTSARLETYVYDMGSYGWAPFYKDYINIAYTALGKVENKAVMSTPNYPYSNDYGRYSDLTVAERGVANYHMSCYDAEIGDLLYSFGSSVNLVDYNGDVGQWSSIALDLEGNPHIAYYDATNMVVKHAVKQTADGSARL